MGDPRKQRRKYNKPAHPWQAERINEERGIVKEYGIGNKKELWKQVSFLSRFKAKAKQLATAEGEQAEKEKQQMFERLTKYGLLQGTQDLGSILGLDIRDVLERRLQTIVQKKNLAKTAKQARQFITHQHIKIGEQTITSPSYLVTVEEEPQIQFSQTSQLVDEMHPERVQKQVENTKIVEEKTEEDLKTEKPKTKVAKKKEKKEKKEDKKEEAKEAPEEKKEEKPEAKEE